MTQSNLLDPAYSGDSYADVKRACHSWLMRKDPTYRRACERNAEHRDTLAKRKARKSKRFTQPS